MCCTIDKTVIIFSRLLHILPVKTKLLYVHLTEVYLIVVQGIISQILMFDGFFEFNMLHLCIMLSVVFLN